jgi:hypothetical protein
VQRRRRERCGRSRKRVGGRERPLPAVGRRSTSRRSARAVDVASAAQIGTITCRGTRYGFVQAPVAKLRRVVARRASEIRSARPAWSGTIARRLFREKSPVLMTTGARRVARSIGAAHRARSKCCRDLECRRTPTARVHGEHWHVDARGGRGVPRLFLLPQRQPS